MNKTNISWTDFTWNPLIGCSKVSDGCKNCYAETMALRLANMWEKSQVKGTEKYTKVVSKDGWNGNIILDEDKLHSPSKRKKHTKIFIGSMTDLFHENTKWSDIDEVIKVVINNPQHTFQILTKRPERMREYFNDRYKLNSDFNRFGNGSIPNLWLGVSVENQKESDARIPILVDTKASIRFLSVEPLIEKVDLDLRKNDMIDWVIVGGESGTKATSRLFKAEWSYDIWMECRDTGTSFFFKQRGSNNDFANKKVFQYSNLFMDEYDFEKIQEFPR